LQIDANEFTVRYILNSWQTNYKIYGAYSEKRSSKIEYDGKTKNIQYPSMKDLPACSYTHREI
jgi:hypothetical protein